MPQIKVGGRPCQISWPEWHALILPVGTPVHFERRRMDGKTERGSGIFTGTSYYDGVSAAVDIGEGVTVRLHPYFRDRMKRIRRDSELPFLGEGI